MRAIIRISRSALPCELPDQHRKLENKNRGSRGGNRKKRLRESDGENCVCHVPSPWIEIDRTVLSLHRTPMHNKRST
jgi:hypothetical protein